MVVYLIHNTVNGKYYVGETTRTLDCRWKEHLKHARLGSKTYLHRAIRKYGTAAFQVHALMSSLRTSEQLKEQERFLIRLFRASDSNFGYNRTPGGEGVGPEPKSEEHRRKIGEGVRKPRVIKQCRECSRDFSVPPSDQSIFCSQECFHRSTRSALKFCEVCRMEFQPAAKKQKLCSHNCRNLFLKAQNPQLSTHQN